MGWTSCGAVSLQFNIFPARDPKQHRGVGGECMTMLLLLLLLMMMMMTVMVMKLIGCGR